MKTQKKKKKWNENFEYRTKYHNFKNQEIISIAM